MMKIAAINGSPKGKRSTTYRMVESLLKGAREAGASTEHHLLATLNILPCRGCFGCWLKTPGKCVLKDDREQIALADVDLIIYATPLYADNVTGLLKNFMDRSIGGMLPFMETDENGESVHVKKPGKTPLIMVMANCGFPEQSHFQVLQLFFRRLARNMQSTLIAEIYRGQGPLLLREAFQEQANAYFALLERAGHEIVQQRRLSAETSTALEQPFVPHDRYRQRANESFQKILDAQNQAPDSMLHFNNY